MGTILVDREGYLDNSTLEMDCSMADIIRGAITVGKSCQDAQNISCIEKLFRISSILMTVQECEGASDSFFQASSIFNKLDPSEKGAMTYFLGMAITKLISERYFDVLWLMHVDVYHNSYRIESNAGGKPDFFGRIKTNCGQERWCIFESKGRTGGLDREAISRGKEQTQYLRTINGVIPCSRNVVQAYFKGKEQILRGYLVDPVDDNKGTDIKLGLKDLFESYYQPFYDLIELIGRENNKEQNGSLSYLDKLYDIVYIKPLGIYLGLAKNIIELLLKFDEKKLFEALKQHEEKALGIKKYLIENGKDRLVSIGNDGIFVAMKDE
ncbi:hypothetical protein SAMN02745671_02566 [Anaerovibrio lipolyticus DSM 3074]|uniref:Restriction endonuclease n=2 Tax=Anaerovibrio lipolyticus TaxID=82374 RepID=A0A0B2JWK2_9FIRM|nr:hypothetical protein [Anaerovibrio lipolyticus]KHM52695.1 hypothetical protein NZ47_03265 [Anaerovibrio lipolyticus]SHJ06573.1 hypothetical protein SAMN02745671_02566 [Anaerovibrio lipolyticus DSM 3074]